MKCLFNTNTVSGIRYDTRPRTRNGIDLNREVEKLRTNTVRIVSYCDDCIIRYSKGEEIDVFHEGDSWSMSHPIPRPRESDKLESRAYHRTNDLPFSVQLANLLQNPSAHSVNRNKIIYLCYTNRT